MQPQAYERDTPGYIKALRWGGLGVAGLGAVFILTSYGNYDEDSMNAKEYEDARSQNDIGWGLVAIGAAAFVISFPLTPDPVVDPNEAENEARERPRPSAAVAADGRGTLTMRLAF
jgi:hypothetical protein